MITINLRQHNELKVEIVVNLKNLCLVIISRGENQRFLKFFITPHHLKILHKTLILAYEANRHSYEITFFQVLARDSTTNEFGDIICIIVIIIGFNLGSKNKALSVAKLVISSLPTACN